MRRAFSDSKNLEPLDGVGPAGAALVLLGAPHEGKMAAWHKHDQLSSLMDKNAKNKCKYDVRTTLHHIFMFIFAFTPLRRHRVVCFVFILFRLTFNITLLILKWSSSNTFTSILFAYWQLFSLSTLCR